MPFIAGQNVGPYTITEQLGQGGMATVFKAYHPVLDRYVALKAMHPAFMEDPNFLARFQREAQVVARLEHPNIVPIYDFAEHENRPYLVMKYIEGETLKARLARGLLRPEEIDPIVEAVGAALAHAHAKGILHRDIKPSNVLLGENGQIFLADFGLARIAEAGASTLSSDVMLGTPQYISPEQAMGKPELDEGTDIYSFGVMLYEAVTGRVPFSADTPYSIIHDHIYTPLPLPRSINPGVSEAVERVLLKALSKDRTDRFSRVDELAAAFRGAMAGKAEATPPPPAPEVQAPETAIRPAEPGQRPEAASAAAEMAAAPAEAPAARRRRWRWWYTIPLVLGLCLCGFVALSLVQDQPGVGEPTPEPPIDRPVGDAPGLLPEVMAAQNAVNENPDDPFAHLELAAVFYDTGDPEAAARAMAAAQELAGDEVPDFYLAAGDVLADRDQWFMAATMYLGFTGLVDGPLPPDVRERLELALYLAAEDSRLADLLENAGELDRRDLLLVDTVRGRVSLVQGRVPLAQVAVNSVLRREPDYPPALLLQAEIHLARGEREQAVEILERLIGTDQVSWVPPFAEAILIEIRG